MLDIKVLRSDFENVCRSIRSRGKPYKQLDQFKQLDTKYREIITKIQDLNSERNKKSKEIGTIINKKSDKKIIDSIQKDVKNIKTEIDNLQVESDKLKEKLNDILLSVPNIPDKSVVIGEDESKNKEIHK